MINLFRLIKNNYFYFILIFTTLIINLFESIYSTSLRDIFTVVLTIFIVSINGKRAIKITNYSILYISILLIYIVFFYYFGSGNNLILHLLTIFFGVVLLYNSLISSGYSIEKVWMGFKILWALIYITLVIEFFIVLLGGQEILYDIFPEENRLYGLPAYRSLVNSSRDYFGLNFDGLNSITLQAQAYSQYCAMLMIFGFSFVGRRFNKINFRRLTIYFLLPIFLFLISPTTTAFILIIFEFLFLFVIRKWMVNSGIISYIILIIPMITITFYFLNSELVMKYDISDLYSLFLENQINHFLERPLSETLIGYSMEEYDYVSTKFEIAFLSYVSMAGLIISVINIIILLYFIKDTLRQAKLLYNNLNEKNNVEIQLINLTLILAMLLSSIHFPVITNYLGSLLFISHLAFGFYMLYLNRNFHLKEQGFAIKK